jgi:hypothetical protein
MVEDLVNRYRMSVSQMTTYIFRLSKSFLAGNRGTENTMDTKKHQRKPNTGRLKLKFEQQKQVSGLIESDHIKSARTQLKEQHLTILNIKPSLFDFHQHRCESLL